MNKRIHELDLARIILVLTLPLIHIMEFWGNMYGCADMIAAEVTVILNPLCEILCIFVAPTFMICMGINMSLTTKSTYRDFIKRGAVLIGVELAFNILRFEIPGLVSLGLAHSAESKELIASLMREGSINSDILALAGLAFIVFGLFKKHGLKPGTILIICVMLYLIDFALNKTIMPGLGAKMNYDLANLLGNFIYVDTKSTFPLMEWLTVISIGHCLGVAIKSDEKGRDSLFNKILICSLIVFGICLIYAFMYTENPIESLNKSGLRSSLTPLCLIGDTSAALLFLAVVYKVYNLFELKGNDKFNEWSRRFSSNITYFYCIQWMIVGWGMMFGIALLLGSKIFKIWGVVFSCIIICIISYYIGNFLHMKFKKNR